MAINDNAGLQNSSTEGDDAEDVTARIERLGRQRPEKFTTFWQEMGFCISLVTSSLMAVGTSIPSPNPIFEMNHYLCSLPAH